MEYLEIQDGILINLDKIDAIEKVDEYSCKVYVGKRIYLSTLSYSTLMSMIKNNEVVDKKTSREEKTDSIMKKLDAVLSTTGHFAG